MTFETPGLLRAVLAALTLGLLGACATHGPAPVSERAASAPRPEVAARSGKDYHVVRKGDTLYSIARETGREARDIAAWNNLDAPGGLRIGQTLRVAPPDGPGAAPAGTAPAAVAVARPIAGPAEVEVKPLSGGPAGVAADSPRGAGDGGVKREPKGGKQPYSEQALAQFQRKEAVPPRAAEAPAAVGTIRPDVKTGSRSETKAEGKPDADGTTGTKAGDNARDREWTWPAEGEVLAPFHSPANKGIDIGGRPGDPILAAASGKVVYIGSMKGYGNLLIMKHPNGFVSAYANIRKSLVKEQVTIAKGRKIAEMGEDGADKGKLHFQIRLNGSALDPLKYLPPR